MVVASLTMQEPTPQTQCSNCQTVFEVPQELLESSDTRVRCGECLQIFDAQEGLRIDVDKSASSTEATTARVGAEPTHQDESASHRKGTEFSDLDVTYSDFDLFSEDADTPYLDYFDETRNPVDLDFDSVDLEMDQTFSDTLFRHDATITADIPITAGSREPGKKTEGKKVEATGTDRLGAIDADAGNQASGQTTQSEKSDPEKVTHLGRQARIGYQDAVQIPDNPIEFNYLHDDEQPSAEVEENVELTDQPELANGETTFGGGSVKKRHWKFTALMATLLALLLGGLYAYRERASLYNSPTARPMLVGVCNFIGCEVPLQSDLSQLRVLRMNVYSHPNVKDALVINVVFKNEAAIDQAYPILHIKLFNVRGFTVAARDFKPSEYLAEGMWDEKQTLAANTSIDISLEINDPGSQAYAHTVEFR